MARRPARPAAFCGADALSGRRIAAALLVALLLSPGTLWRTPVSERATQRVTFNSVELPDPAALPDGWSIEGAWELENTALHFGGFSAMILADEGRLRAWTDRGWVLDFAAPDGGDPRSHFTRQRFESGYGQALWDIESATSDPATGTAWFATEFTHAIQRLEAEGQPNGVRVLGDEVDWSGNSGIEALVRLPDGRMLAAPENFGEVLVFAGDPVEGAGFERFRVEWPREGYAASDAALLPDGRVLVLLRRLVWASPPFSTLLAVGDPARLAAQETWTPELLFALDGILPRENYEGLAVRSLPGGGAEIWLVSDDNFSIFQRTLLVRLLWNGV